MSEFTLKVVDNDKPKRIATVDFDEAEYYGDENDGVYYQSSLAEDGWYVSAAVDCNSGNFVEDLLVDDGPYGTKQGAEEAGMLAAQIWCMDNGVFVD